MKVERESCEDREISEEREKREKTWKSVIVVFFCGPDVL